MVDVSSQNNSVSINVSTGGNSANIKTTPDTALFYSEKSREWAISNRIVDGVDYSSKYYANKANESAAKAEKVIEDVKSEAQTQISAIQDVSILEQEQIQEIINRIDDGKAVYMGEDEPTDPIYSVWVSPEDNELSADIKQLSSDVENIKTNIKGKITNCITEIPQRIKLELADGTVTLKAGSEVIVPNGFEADGKTPKFDYKTTQNDISISTAGTSTTQRLLFLNEKTNGFVSMMSDYCYSGTTAPTTFASGYAQWYDTTNNVVKRTSDSGATWTENHSFPVVITTFTNGTVSSIDQIFNGFGYIGSTIWADKGVKCLIPNGRNEDGTLNNIEFTTKKVMTYTSTGGASGENHIQLKEDYIGKASKSFWKYNEQENFNKGSNGSIFSAAFVGSITLTSDIISSFYSKQPFRAVDFNDFNSTPHIVETYKNGSSWYRVWSDGWCEQGGLSTANVTSTTVTFLKTFVNTNYNLTVADSTTTNLSNDTGGVDLSPFVSNYTTTGFRVSQATDGSDRRTSWRACGYIS